MAKKTKKVIYDCPYDIKRQTKDSEGYDIVSNRDITVYENQAVKIPTGLFLKSCDGLYALLFIRSSLGAKGLILLNGVGVIDSDYRDEIACIVQNISREPINIRKGDRIAQLVFFERLGVTMTKDTTETEGDDGNGKDYVETKRKGGFGSTGKGDKETTKK